MKAGLRLRAKGSTYMHDACGDLFKCRSKANRDGHGAGLKRVWPDPDPNPFIFYRFRAGFES